MPHSSKRACAVNILYYTYSNFCYTLPMIISRKLPLLATGLILLGASCTNKLTVQPHPKSVVQLHATGANAFGSLAAVTSTNASPTSSRDSVGTSGAASPSPDLSVKIAAPAVVAYTFTGTAPSLTETSVSVYQRNTGATLPLPSNLTSSAGLGLMDFSTLKNTSIESLNIRRGDELWSITPASGSISMYINSPNPVPLPTEDTNKAPIDTNAAIDVATSFLIAHGISTAAYGSAVATETSAIYPANAKTSDLLASDRPELTNTYHTAQVVFPLLIDGQVTVQQNGEPMGLTLTVDMNTPSVTSLYGLNTTDYNVSPYDAVIDFSAIKTIAERGGMYGSITTGSDVKKYDLGTPDRVLLSSYLYKDNQSLELYIPALRFPITNPPDAYTKYIVVPLAKELINPNPPETILPAATTSGSAGAAPSTR